MSDAVLRGQPVTIKVVFFDAGNNPIDPTVGPFVDVFPAGKNPNNPSTVDADAKILDASMTSLGSSGQSGNTFIIRTGVGRYEYTYTVPTDPDDAPLGSWYTRWNGTVDSQPLGDVFAFVVIGGGSIGASQLYLNNRVNVCILAGVKALDGSTMLEEDFCSYYTTTYNPLYCSARKMRIDYGTFIREIPDDTLNLLIFEASIEADAFTFRAPNPGRMAFFRHARRQFACCLAAVNLLSNQLDSTGGRKQLGDLSIEAGGVATGPNNSITVLQKAIDCMTRWRLILQNGGEGFNLKAQGVVKGESDPDRPLIGRLWGTGGSHAADQVPAANAKAIHSGSRRGLRTYSPRHSMFDPNSDNIFIGSGRLVKKRFF